MEKFSCGCGRSVRDVYYKNGEFMCSRCFWQGNENQFDYIINLLTDRGFAITFQGEPVLVMKHFSADFLDQAHELIRPNADWVILEGDQFWSHFNGNIMNLRSYITGYGRKEDKEASPTVPPPSESSITPGTSCTSCASCTTCSQEDE